MENGISLVLQVQYKKAHKIQISSGSLYVSDKRFEVVLSVNI